jgi:hypothetical protein
VSRPAIAEIAEAVGALSQRKRFVLTDERHLPVALGAPLPHLAASRTSVRRSRCLSQPPRQAFCRTGTGQWITGFDAVKNLEVAACFYQILAILTEFYLVLKIWTALILKIQTGPNPPNFKTLVESCMPKPDLLSPTGNPYHSAYPFWTGKYYTKTQNSNLQRVMQIGHTF